MMHSGDNNLEDWYATISSTLLLLTEKDTLYMFERLYDHTNEDRPLVEDDEVAKLLLDFSYRNPVEENTCTHLE
jgi:hypothetical protein